MAQNISVFKLSKQNELVLVQPFQLQHRGDVSATQVRVFLQEDFHPHHT